MTRGLAITTSTIVLAAFSLIFAFSTYASKRWIDNVDEKINKIDKMEFVLDSIWEKVKKLP